MLPGDPVQVLRLPRQDPLKLGLDWDFRLCWLLRYLCGRAPDLRCLTDFGLLVRALRAEPFDLYRPPRVDNETSTCFRFCSVVP